MQFDLHTNKIPLSISPLNQSAKTSLNSSPRQRDRFVEFFFPTRSRIKLQSSNSKQSLNEQVAKLNQRAVDVQTGIEQSISSLHTQRLQYLTSLNEKTRDLEKAAATLESSSSKHLKRELEKTRRLSIVLKLILAVCLILFSLMLGYMITQSLRDKGIL